MPALLAAILLVQAQAQSEADKLEAALKKFGDRTYRMLMKGVEYGSSTLKTRVESEGGRKVAVLEDRVVLKEEGEGDGGTLVSKVSLDGFRLLSLKAVRQGQTDMEIAVKDGEAIVTVIQGKKKLPVTESTIVFTSISRVVCAREQKVGTEFKVDILDARELQKGHAFKCVSKETLDIGGVKRDAFRWEQKGEGRTKFPKKDLTYKIENTYWVSPDGYLLRMAAFEDGQVEFEMVLDAK